MKYTDIVRELFASSNTTKAEIANHVDGDIYHIIIDRYLGIIYYVDKDGRIFLKADARYIGQTLKSNRNRHGEMRSFSDKHIQKFVIGGKSEYWGLTNMKYDPVISSEFVKELIDGLDC
jgi:hypothetical protein